MLLIETEECQECKFYEEGDEFNKCNEKNINDLEPGGVFNYYADDVVNCECKCQFFKKRK